MSNKPNVSTRVNAGDCSEKNWQGFYFGAVIAEFLANLAHSALVFNE